MNYSVIALYRTPNAVSQAFRLWTKKLQYRHPFLGFHLASGDGREEPHEAVQLKRLRVPKSEHPKSEQAHCLIFEAAFGRYAAYFRKPRNLLWFFIVEGDCLSTARELESLGIEQMAKRRVLESHFFLGPWPARPKQRAKQRGIAA